MITKLCKLTNDPDRYEVSLMVTGAGGFGKTSLVISLCHHPVIEDYFTDGFMFITLGPHEEVNPTMKLKALYRWLTDEQCDISIVEQQIKELTYLYYRNLLVIIDDVWHVEDAEPIVKAFSSCKIVLTSRINDLDKYIPTKEVVNVSAVSQTEAVSILTSKLIDVNTLSQGDVSQLEELAKDAHMWPLLLSLVRGQLFHNLTRKGHHSHKAINQVRIKFNNIGLMGFDKKDCKDSEKSRQYTISARLQVTMGLLTKSLSDKLKSLILYTGIGSSLQTAVLHNLWKTTEQEAEKIVDTLWTYGIVTYTDITVAPYNDSQNCVEVHSVICQYIIESMDSKEMITLSPYAQLGTHQSVFRALRQQLSKLFAGTLFIREHLVYRLNEIEYVLIPCYLKEISMWAVTDPHCTIVMLNQIQELLASENITVFFPSLNDEITTIISECQKLLKDTYRLSRQLNKIAQQCLVQKDYEKLFHTIETYMHEYAVGLVSQQAAAKLNAIIPYCDGELLHIITALLEYLKIRGPEYHDITLITLPLIKLHAKLLHQITTALQGETHDIELLNQYFASRQYEEEYNSVQTNRQVILKRIAPNWLQAFGLH